MKKLINAALTFAVVGFMVYISTIVSGFFGFCVDMDCCTYHKLVLTLVVSGAITFGLCLIRNCRNIK